MIRRRLVGDFTASFVAMAILGLLAFTLYGVFYVKIPPENKSTADLVVGALLTFVGLIVGYHYGTSVGARRMGEAMTDQAAAAGPANVAAAVTAAAVAAAPAAATIAAQAAAPAAAAAAAANQPQGNQP